LGREELSLYPFGETQRAWPRLRVGDEVVPVNYLLILLCSFETPCNLLQSNDTFIEKYSPNYLSHIVHFD